MASNDGKFEFSTNRGGNTIDLQGVAAFASLVETVAKELGAVPGKIAGVLPQGAAFEELVGEIVVNTSGFHRSVTMITAPGQPLKMRVSSSWKDGLSKDSNIVSGVDAQFILGASSDRILPQARALARHIEEAFHVLDRMATLGQGSRLQAMSISEQELARFEVEQGSSLVQSYSPKVDVNG